MSKKNYFAHETAVIDEGCEIGENTKIWHFSHIMSGSTIGSNCIFGQNTFVAEGVSIGNNVKVQNNVSLYKGVICENDVFIGPSAVFTNVNNPRSFIERKEEFQTTHIKKGASIGANATIICGIEIGEFAFIAAGAVVKQNVPNYALVAGVPSKQIGWMSEFGLQIRFNSDNFAVCQGTGAKYRLAENRVYKVE